jgi:hypothetical protein
LLPNSNRNSISRDDPGVATSSQTLTVIGTIGRSEHVSATVRVCFAPGCMAPRPSTNPSIPKLAKPGSFDKGEDFADR